MFSPIRLQLVRFISSVRWEKQMYELDNETTHILLLTLLANVTDE